MLALSTWLKFSSLNYGFPRTYTNFRFKNYGGSRNGFKIAMKKIYGLCDEDFKYSRTNEHKQKLSESIRKMNDIKNI